MPTQLCAAHAHTHNCITIDANTCSNCNCAIVTGSLHSCVGIFTCTLMWTFSEYAIPERPLFYYLLCRLLRCYGVALNVLLPAVDTAKY